MARPAPDSAGRGRHRVVPKAELADFRDTQPAAATVLFSDSLEGTLSQWTNPASAAEIVAAPDGGNALTFDLLQGGSSLLTTNSSFTSSTGSFTLTFETYTNCGFTSGCGAFFAIDGGGQWFLSDTSFGSDALFPDAPEPASMTVLSFGLFGLAAIRRKHAEHRLSFEELPVYTASKERIFALVHLPWLSEEVSTDLRDMVGRRLTFEQALARDNTSILRVQKSRLFKYRETVWPEIERVI